MQLQLIHCNSSWFRCEISYIVLNRMLLTDLQIIFCLNSLLAWFMRADTVIKLIEKWSYDYIKMDCADDKCYGVLAVSSPQASEAQTEYSILGP